MHTFLTLFLYWSSTSAAVGCVCLRFCVELLHAGQIYCTSVLMDHQLLHHFHIEYKLIFSTVCDVVLVVHTMF